jgi:hypothetical protein
MSLSGFVLVEDDGELNRRLLHAEEAFPGERIPHVS